MLEDPRALTVSSALAVALLIPQATAQESQRFHIDASPKPTNTSYVRHSVCKTPDGTTYAITKRPSGQLRLHALPKGAARFETVDVELADADSGVGENRPTTCCAIAADTDGVLHILWARYYYPSYHAQYYRRYDPKSGTISSIVRTSKTTDRRSAAMSIAVDTHNRVFVAAPSGNSWVARLLCIYPPKASDPARIPRVHDLGRISRSGSSQFPALAIDVRGRVHATYYCNQARGELRHVYYVPEVSRAREGKGWYPSGNGRPQPYTLDRSNARCIFVSELRADEKGSVHCGYIVKPDTRSAVLRYRRWEPRTKSWSKAIDVARWNTPQGHDPNAHFTLALPDGGERVLFFHRAFIDRRKSRNRGIDVIEIGDGSLVRIASVEQSSTDAARYTGLSVVHALWPESMRMKRQVELSYALPSSGQGERFRMLRWSPPGR